MQPCRAWSPLTTHLRLFIQVYTTWYLPLENPSFCVHERPITGFERISASNNCNFPVKSPKVAIGYKLNWMGPQTWGTFPVFNIFAKVDVTSRVDLTLEFIYSVKVHSDWSWTCFPSPARCISTGPHVAWLQHQVHSSRTRKYERACLFVCKQQEMPLVSTN